MYDTHASPAVWRTRRDIVDLFGDFELVDPGVTWTPLWHPEETARDAPDVTFGSPNESVVLAGVARKPVRTSG
jgi:S-adenosyl methyltransferase